MSSENFVENVAIPGDPFTRIRVEYDTFNTNPRTEDYMLTGAVTIQDRAPRNIIDVEPLHGDTMELAAAYERFGEARWTTATDAETQAGAAFWRVTPGWEKSPEEIVVRYARAIHGAHVEWDDKNGCFWFVNLNPNDGNSFTANWPELELFSPEHFEKQAKVIKQEREIYEAWCEGEIYHLTIERHESTPLRVEGVEPLFDLTAVDINAQDLDESGWVEDDECSVGGFYLTDEYTALDAAKDTFRITPILQEES